MAFAKIAQVAHYAPTQVVSNDDLAEIGWIPVMNGLLVGQVSFEASYFKRKQQVI